MKILQINSVCKSGSTGQIAYCIHTWLQDAGYESKIAYGRGKQIDDNDVRRVSSDWEVYAHAVLTRLTGSTGYFSPVATNKLLRMINKDKPNVVHLHNIHGYYTNAYQVLAYLKRHQIRTVITLHDEWMYTGKCGHAYRCNGWLNECGNCPQIKEYPSSLIFDKTRAMLRKKKQVFEKFDHVSLVTPSQWLAGRVEQSFLKEKRITVIPNGIDTEIFQPREAGILRERYNPSKAVLHVTADFEDPHKGGEYVLDLAQRMPDISFFIVGNRKLIENAPINVHAIGRTADQIELAQWYSFADVTLLTSERETFSMVCAESLACGTPVVGFEAGAPIEVAPQGYGRFVPYGDIDALESAMTMALSGGLHSKEACASFGRSRYAKDVMAQRYLELYKSGC